MQEELKPRENWKIYLGSIIIILAAVGVLFSLPSLPYLTASGFIIFIVGVGVRVLIGLLFIKYGTKQKWQNYYRDIIRFKRVSSMQEIATIAGKDILEVKKAIGELYSKGKLTYFGVDINFVTDQITYNNL